jgi:serine-threonine kinase receptor-associated protein
LPTNIKSLIWDKYRNIIFSSGEDNVIRVWDPRSNIQISQIQASSNITNMELSLDYSTLSFTAGKKVEFWDPLRLTPIKDFTVDFDVSCVSMNPVYKSKFVVGAVNDLWVRSFDFETGEVQQLYKGHHGPVHSISHSPDGEIYATGSEDGTIRLWQTNPETPYGLWQYSKEKESNSPSLLFEGQTEVIKS